MGRSVDYLSSALFIAYFIADPTDKDGKIADIDPDTEEEILRNPDDSDYEYCFDNLFTNVACGLKAKYPTLFDCDRWDGNETRIFLENEHCEIGISTYDVIVSISIRVNINGGYNNRPDLAEAWIKRVWPSMRVVMMVNSTCHAAVIKQGTFSSGQSIYAIQS